MTDKILVLAAVGVIVGASLTIASMTSFSSQTALKPSPPPPKVDQLGDARTALMGTLRDPDSAKFGKIFETRFEGRDLVCGEVNAKNGFGGYVGMTPFVYFPDTGHVEMITDPVTLAMTKGGVRAFFKGCRAR